jgi:hypothetical protein
MTNHPTRSRGPYTAEIFGSSWKQGPTATFTTIRECREWAEEYGTTADSCTIRDAGGRIVAQHRRNGQDWFRASI